MAYFQDFKRLESLLDASKTKFLDYSPEYILITAYNPNPNEETLYTNYTTKRFNEEMASSVSDEDINEIFMKVERGANQTLKNYDIDLEVVYDLSLIHI